MKYQRAHNLCFQIGKTTGKLIAYVQFGDAMVQVKFTHLKDVLTTMKKTEVLVHYIEAANELVCSMP